MRTALGATRARVIRQIVSESLILGLAGGVLGLAIAAAGLRGVHAVATEPFFRQIAIDFRVVGVRLRARLAGAAGVRDPADDAGAAARRPQRAERRDGAQRRRRGSGARPVGAGRGPGGPGGDAAGRRRLVVRSMERWPASISATTRRRCCPPRSRCRRGRSATTPPRLRLRQRLVERARAIPGVEGAATVTGCRRCTSRRGLQSRSPAARRRRATGRRPASS